MNLKSIIDEEVRANCVRNAKEFELLNPLSEVLMNGNSLKLKGTRFLGEGDKGGPGRGLLKRTGEGLIEGLRDFAFRKWVRAVVAHQGQAACLRSHER